MSEIRGSIYKESPESFSVSLEHEGISLRDYFAGQILASCGRDIVNNTLFRSEWCGRCYELADAMLQAREVKR